MGLRIGNSQDGSWLPAGFHPLNAPTPTNHWNPVLTPDEVVARCPRLWHDAPVGAWERLQQHGLRRAAQPINAADLNLAEPRTLEERRRHHVSFDAYGGRVAIRDQGPLFARKDLAAILGDGLSTADWIGLLNRRLYLFADRRPMGTLVTKYAKRDGAQDVIEISPRALLRATEGRIELASQNTGAIARKKGPQKGLETFVPMEQFPNQRPNEVTVIDGIDDLSVVVRAERHHQNEWIEELTIKGNGL